MVRLICDTDGLIKLNKAGVLRRLAQAAHLMVGPEVWREVVITGRARGYPDADEIEQHQDCLHRERVKKTKLVKSQLLPGIGKGEAEALQLYRQTQADGIVSDDRAFLSLLDTEQIPYLTPSTMILWLVVKQALSITEAEVALERLRPLIRPEQYRLVKAKLQTIEGSER